MSDLKKSSTMCRMMRWDGHWTTKQPHLWAIVQAWRFSLFRHIARMTDETDAKKINSFPLENWRRPPGRPCTTWMSIVNNALSLSIRPQFAIECLRCLIQQFFGPKFREGMVNQCKPNFNVIWERHEAFVCKKLYQYFLPFWAQCTIVTDRQTYHGR